MTQLSFQSLGALIVGGMLLVAGIPSIATAFSSNPIDGWEQTAKITPDDADEPGWNGYPAHLFTYFGASTAIDEDLLVVGTGIDNTDPRDFAYVFERTATGEWKQAAKLDPDPEAETVSGFGASVAVDASTGTIVVGNPGYDRGPLTYAGATYVFEQDAQGDWTQTDLLLMPEISDRHSEWGPEFGKDVAVDGNTIAVGASDADVGDLEDGGKVYTYERIGEGWERSANLTSPNVEERSFFGRALALDGDRLVVAAQGETVGGLSWVGAVYVFERPDDEWIEIGRITPPDPSRGAGGAGAFCFGFDVDIAGDMVLVGDPCWGSQLHGYNPTYSSTGFTGSAYIYEQAPNTWVLDEQLFGSRKPGSFFGASVALDESKNSLIISADSGPMRNSGVGYMFEKASSSWEREVLLGNDTGEGDRFGWSVSMSHGTAIVGAPFDDNRRDGTPWPVNDEADIRGLGTGQGKAAGTVYAFQHDQQPDIPSQIPAEGPIANSHGGG